MHLCSPAMHLFEAADDKLDGQCLLRYTDAVLQYDEGQLA
jgi:hypothetical protein